MTGVLEAALEWEERGAALLPIERFGKRPHMRVLREVHGLSGWGPLRQRPASPSEIKAWAEVGDFDLGMITGTPSNGLVVLDFDRRPDGVTHPPTPVASTRRGHHAFFRANSPVTSRTFGWGELQGEGKYVVIPPSQLSNGESRAWVISPDYTDFADFRDVQLGGTVARNNHSNPVIGIEHVMPMTSLPPSVGTQGRLACDETAVQAVAEHVFRVPARLGQSFPCILPGHREAHPSSSLHLDPITKVWMYHDFHAASDREKWLTLAEVRASLGAKRVVKLSGPVHSRWYDRVFYDAGLINPAPVEGPRLPSNASRSVERVYAGFRLLLGLRWNHEFGEAAPFTYPFMAAWCDVTQKAARSALWDLLRLGLIVKEDAIPVGGRMMNLYNVGPGIAGRS